MLIGPAAVTARPIGNGQHLQPHGFLADTFFMEIDSECAFCAIVAGRAPAVVVRRWDSVLAIRPRGGGVTAGHVLVLPHTHVADVAACPATSAACFAAAAELAAELPSCNVIASRGAAATQTVFHLHLHVVPRNALDNLALPWTPQPGGQVAAAAGDLTGRG